MAYIENKKWRLTHPSKRQAQTQRYYAKTKKPGMRVRKKWTVEEDLLITSTQRPCDMDLSKMLGTSVQSIQVRRSKLTKIKG